MFLYNLPSACLRLVLYSHKSRGGQVQVNYRSVYIPVWDWLILKGVYQFGKKLLKNIEIMLSIAYNKM